MSNKPSRSVQDILQDRGGATSLFFLLILPLLAAAAVVGFDLSRAELARTRAQATADRLALIATSHLPDIEAAKEIVFRESQVTSPYRAEVLPVRKRRSVGVNVTGEVTSSISSLFGKTLSWKIKACAEAQMVPGDYVLIVSDAATLRPQVTNTGGRIELGSPWSDQPPSKFFLLTPPTSLCRQSAWCDWHDGGGGLYPRWATESCFNEHFSTIKLAAISLADTLSANDDNRLALIYAPGDPGNRGHSVLRSIYSPLSSEDRALSTPGGYFTSTEELIEENFKQKSEARWPRIVDDGYGLSHDSCLLFSQLSKTEGDSEYFLAQLPKHLGSNFRFNQNSPIPLATESLFRPTLLQSASTDYMDNNLRLREAIWWHRAQLSRPDIQAAFDLNPPLEEALRQLATPTNEDLLRDKIRRGNTYTKSPKKIVAIFDNLVVNNLDELQNTLRNAAEMNISLVMVAYLHARLLDSERNSTIRLLERLKEISTIISSETSDNHPADAEASFLTTHVADDAHHLQEVILPRIMASGRIISLKDQGTQQCR